MATACRPMTRAVGLSTNLRPNPSNSNVGFLFGSWEMKLSKKRWSWISLAVLICILGLGFVGYRALDRHWQEMPESKWVRTSPATVVRKDQGRVYYHIDNFDNLPKATWITDRRYVGDVLNQARNNRYAWFPHIRTLSMFQQRAS